MKKMIKYYFLIVMLLFISKIINAQISFNKITTVIPASPSTPVNLATGATLDGVDYATGTLNVAIPIYEVKSKDLVVPITLTYNATGVKPTDPEYAPLGVGWVLNVGGEINREVNGRASGSSITSVDWSSLQGGSASELEKVQNMVDGKYDTEPDVYYFSYPGGGGKFLRADNGSYLVFPYDPLIKVGLTANGYKITDGGGTNYFYFTHEQTETRQWEFYKKEKINGRDSMKFVSAYDSQSEQTYWSKYSLNKIISPSSKDSIVFSYDGSFLGGTQISYNESLPVASMCYFSGSTLNCASSYTPQEPILSKTEIKRTGAKALSKITFPNGYVDFISPHGRIDTIKVFSNDITDKYLRRIVFSYDTLTANRDKLVSLSFYDRNDSLVNVYRFAYHEKHRFPRPDTKSLDYWGYFNGSNNKTLLARPLNSPVFVTGNDMSVKRKENREYYNIPVWETGPQTISLANRSPNFDYAITGTLRSIITATGGIYEYGYSSHEYWEYSGGIYSIRFGGGIRIDSINYYDANRKLLKRKIYEYGKDIQGDRVATVPKTALGQDYMYALNASVRATQTQYNLFSHPVNDLNLYNGSAVMYLKTTEYQQDAVGVDNGKTEYYFKSFSWSDDLLENPYKRNVNQGHLRGLPERKVIYSRSGNQYHPKSEENYTYKMFENPIVAGGYKAGLGVIRIGNYNEAANYSQTCLPTYSWNPMSEQREWGERCFGGSGQGVEGTAINYLGKEVDPNDLYFDGKYKVLSFSHRSIIYKPVQQQTIDYDGGLNPIIRTQVFTYDNNAHLLATSIREDISKGDAGSTNDSIIKKIRYPQDILSIGNPALTSQDSLGIRQLEQKNILNVPVEEETYKNTTLLYKTRTDFKLWTTDLIMPIRQNVKLGSNPMETVASFQKYDAFGNILEQSKERDMQLTYLWDYANVHPVSEVKNATNNDIAYTSFEADNNGNWVVPSIIRDVTVSVTGRKAFNMSNAGTTGITRTGLIAGNTYKLTYWTKNTIPYSITGTLGTVLKGVTNSKGWTYYEHKISGVSTVKVSGSGFIDELRLYPATAQMTTFTFSPLVGMTSQCDTNNQLSYYEYDSFGRLKVIRDRDGNVLKQFDLQYQQPVTR